MPAASCRIMPARSIRRCDTISASFGVSRRMGRKKRDRRMDFLEGFVDDASEKADRLQKHKAWSAFSGIYRELRPSIFVLGGPCRSVVVSLGPKLGRARRTSGPSQGAGISSGENAFAPGGTAT